MKHFIKNYLVIFFLLAPDLTWAQAQYLYSSGSIPVRGNPNPSSDTISSIEPGQSFEVIKWNNHNTRVRLSDGRIGWIKKSALAKLAPTNDTGTLSTPLNLTLTADSTLDTASAPAPAAENGETVAGDTTSEVVTTDDPAGDYAADYESGDEVIDSNAVSALLAKVTSSAWTSATKRRKIADFCGGGYRSGNRSKCMCAQAAKEALVSSGVCNSYPAGHALQTHTRGTLKSSCPKLSLSGGLDPWKALGGSVIVYSGYAGRRPHNYGHIEIKIPVTSEFKKSLGRAGNGLTVGSFLYCSDFCAAKPTKTKTNKVVAIYNLKGE